MSQNFTLKTTDNHQIDITTYGINNLEKRNCIIFVHGFKGFKDWGFVPYLGNHFGESGYFVITFNFSHNGVSENSTDFNELNKFALNTYTREIHEVQEIINAYKSGFFGKISQSNKVALLGHSRGGGVAIIVSSIVNNISALVTWSSISNFDRWSKRQKNEWRKNKYFEILNTRTNQLMKLNTDLLDDIEKNSSGLLNIKSALMKMDIPYLIVHGDQDLGVPVKEAESIYSWSNKSSTEFLKIIGTGHTFDIKHPFEGSSKAFEKVLEKSSQFFSKSLGG